jgi:hypothetical protein
MPDYSTTDSSQGLLMKGPLMRMTIGNWIDGQLCKLDNLSYRPLAESPWEIGLNDEELNLLSSVTKKMLPDANDSSYNQIEKPKREDLL